MTEIFRFLYLPNLDGYEYQAIRETVFTGIIRGVSPNTMIITYPLEAYVRVARQTDLNKKVRRKYCAENNIPIARSTSPHASGSGYTSSQRMRCILLFDKSLYTKLSRNKLIDAIIYCLNQLGIVANISGRNNIMVGDRKLASYSARSNDYLVISGFRVYLSSSIDMAEKTIISPKDMRRYTTTIKDEIDRLVSHEEMRDRMFDAYQQTLHISFEEGVLSDTEKIMADQYLIKHKSKLWIETGRWSPIKDYWRPK